jgi:hypothetical protein
MPTSYVSVPFHRALVKTVPLNGPPLTAPLSMNRSLLKASVAGEVHSTR